MPPDANKRKAAKKKNKAKANKKSSSSSNPRGSHHHGDSDGGPHNSPRPVVKTEKKENNLSANESSTIEKTEKNVKETQGETETNRGSNSQKPNEKSLNSKSNSLDNKSPSKKKSAVIELASVADYLSQPIDSSPQKRSHKVEDFKPIDHSLVEEQNDLVVPETPLKPTVINENDSKNNETSKENKVQKLDQKDYSISENNLISDSSTVKCPYCGKRDDDGVKETEPPVQCSEQQPLLDSTPQETKKASLKSCCGIFELFSGSSR